MAARAGGRPARVHAARQRREPDRLHVRRRRGRRDAAAGAGGRHERDGRFRVGRAGHRQRRRAGDGAGARRRRRPSGTQGETEEYIQFRSVDRAMRDGSASRRRSRSTTACGACMEFLERERHAPAARHRLSRARAPRVRGRGRGPRSQVTGVVGYFYAMYRAEVLARVGRRRGRDILEVGCGEGMMFDGTGTQPVQMDVSMTRVSRAAASAAPALRRRLRAAVRRRLVRSRAARRGARAHARAVADAGRGAARAEAGRHARSSSCRTTVTMSAGRLLLAKVSDPLSGSPDVHDAAADARLAARRLPDRRGLHAAVPARCRSPLNLYYFVVAEKTSGGEGR